MAWSLGGNDLGQINNESYSKQGNLLQITTPTEDDDENEVYDFSGVTGNIRVSGSKAFDSIASLSTFVLTLLAFVDGQQTPISYVSDVLCPTGKNVMVNEVTITYDTQSPLQANYDLVLFPANENSISIGGA